MIFFQEFSPLFQTHLDGGRGLPNHIGNFLCAVFLDIIQQHDDSKFFWKRHQCVKDSQIFRLWGKMMDLLQIYHRVPHMKSLDVAALIDCDSDQPSLFVIGAFKGRRFAEIFQERLLHGILSVGFIAQNDQADPKQHIAVLAHDPVDLICGAYRYGSHCINPFHKKYV